MHHIVLLETRANKILADDEKLLCAVWATQRYDKGVRYDVGLMELLDGEINLCPEV